MAKKPLILPIFFCFLMGCGSDPAGSSGSPHIDPAPVFPPIVIKSGEENGHPAGIRLSIQTTIETDSTTAYKLISSYEGKPIGLIVVIPRKVDGKKTGSNAFFKSLGPPSDLFLHLLTTEYKQHVDSSVKLADSIPFVCMNLKDFFNENSAGPTDDNWVAAEYKLFFDAESIDGDAELFMNINSEGKWVEFAEKDEDYRSQLISLFKRR